MNLGPAFRLPPPRRPRAQLRRSSLTVALLAGGFLWCAVGYACYLLWQALA